MIEKISHISLIMNVSKEHINLLLSKNIRSYRLHDKLILDKIIVEQLDKEVIILLETSGLYSGRISLSAFPKYDTFKEEIILEKMVLKFESKSILARSTNWMLEHSFSNLLKNKLQEGFNKAVKKAISDQIKHNHNTQLPDDFLFYMDFHNIKITAIDIENQVLRTQFNIDAILKLDSKK